MSHPLPFPPRPGRMHEVTGPGATAFAAALAAALPGPVLWVAEDWRPGGLNPLGLALWFDPGRLLLARTRDTVETLAVTEEALRHGAVRLVVAELAQATDLTRGRRLQLAAAAGTSTAICLIPEGEGSNAAETRWDCRPLADAGHEDSTLAEWKLTKNKSGTLGGWHVRWSISAHRLDLVSPAGERPGPAPLAR
ncbi:ImuA family protein [Frigidibacter sp. MR17.24]|uniref:ImuA family protein n=1 Tax=Frigidibacter sp. MR17.24 TaxID=3127345 RepID=UPI003012A8B1